MKAHSTEKPNFYFGRMGFQKLYLFGPILSIGQHLLLVCFIYFCFDTAKLYKRFHYFPEIPNQSDLRTRKSNNVEETESVSQRTTDKRPIKLSNAYTETSMIIVWLESFEDLLFFPISEGIV